MRPGLHGGCCGYHHLGLNTRCMCGTNVLRRATVVVAVIILGLSSATSLPPRDCFRRRQWFMSITACEVILSPRTVGISTCFGVLLGRLLGPEEDLDLVRGGLLVHNWAGIFPAKCSWCHLLTVWHSHICLAHLGSPIP